MKLESANGTARRHYLPSSGAMIGSRISGQLQNGDGGTCGGCHCFWYGCRYTTSLQILPNQAFPPDLQGSTNGVLACLLASKDQKLMDGVRRGM